MEAAAYLVASFGVTWLLWFLAYCNLPPATARLITLGTAVPSVMGVILTLVFGGKSELRALLRAALRFKAPGLWWLYAVLLFPAVLLCACALFAALGGGLPPAQFPLWFLPLAFFYIFACMGPLGEELGWRGFLLKRMLPQWGMVKAGLVLGLIWSTWHIPLFFLSGTVQYELAKMGFLIALPGYFLYTICICLLVTVLYAGTKGNLLLCMVFHTVCNLSLGTAPIILTKGGAALLLILLIFATAFIVKAAVGKRREPSVPN
jgi:membrane protease YdiL (CAAX protease family)